MGGHFSATIGGAQYQAKCIINELVKTGAYEMYYITRQVDPNYRTTGYSIVKLPQAKRGYRYSYLFDMRRIITVLRELQPEVIYQRGLKADTAAAAWYAHNAGCNMIFHVAHDDDVRPFARGNKLSDVPNFLDKKVSEFGLRRARRIVAQTQRQADMLWSNYRLRATDIIGNFGPDVREAVVKSDPAKVVWIANFKASKRPECFVDLVESLQDRHDIEFHMIGRQGDPRSYAQLHRRISELPINYHGEQPIDKVNEILASAHVFVNTSLAEGFPNTFIQAWMREVPVVSLTVDPDNVLATQGLGFCSGKPMCLKRDVLALVDQSQLRSEMGQRARAYALEHHSVRNVRRLMSLL